MGDQLSFASLEFGAKKKRTKRDVFLGEMAAVVPWVKLEALIEPRYPKIGPQGGRRPFPLATMLRIYCLQQWYTLSDPGAEEALYDIQSMRAFAGLDLGRHAIPDETTILNFRHLLERHGLTKAIFEAVAEHLEAKGELLRGGTIVDATLIAASPSTKNEAQKRDPEMSTSKKGNQWYFGMKAHIGVDAKSGLVHTVGVTTGSVHDAKVMDNLIREDDRAVYGDKGYANDRKQRQAEAAGVLWAVKAKAKPTTVDIATPTQPSVRENPGQGQARVPGDEMPIRLSQGSLSWHRQERRTGIRAARARQPIPCPQDTRVRMTNAGAKASLRKVVTPQEARSTTKTRRRHQPTMKK